MRVGGRGLVAGLACLVVTGCTGAAPVLGPTPTPAPVPAPTPPGVPEPTTTNTLPPPPAPTGPAPSTAGDLTAADLPVPAGWRTAVLPGGDEEGYEGNGTWVHARDPRYAAQDVITLGCVDVTRDDYPDPVAALEGNYRDADGEPGVGLVLRFADEAAATAYADRYREQVLACRTATDPLRTEVVEGVSGLMDRRRYADGGTWTEVAERNGATLTLVILSDPGPPVSAPGRAGPARPDRPLSPPGRPAGAPHPGRPGHLPMDADGRRA